MREWQNTQHLATCRHDRVTRMHRSRPGASRLGHRSFFAATTGLNPSCDAAAIRYRLLHFPISNFPFAMQSVCTADGAALGSAMGVLPRSWVALFDFVSGSDPLCTRPFVEPSTVARPSRAFENPHLPEAWPWPDAPMYNGTHTILPHGLLLTTKRPYYLPSPIPPRH